jgi:hypothetical protein
VPNSGFPAVQHPTATKDPVSARPDAKARIIVNGKIATIKKLGYYLLAEDPRKRLFIYTSQKY